MADCCAIAGRVIDEPTAPVLDPRRGKTKTGYLWALARDDRPWGGEDPPSVDYFYAPIRVAHCWAHARRKLKEVFDRDGSEIAAEGLRRIAEIHTVEADIHGISPSQRLSVRQARSAPLGHSIR